MTHNLDLEFEEILNKTCNFFKLEKKVLLGKCRKREIADARHMLYKYTHEAGFKCYYISEKIGKRNHSTVSSGIKTLNQLLNNTGLLKKIYSEYKEHIEEK